jgi:8-oxo-dGTP pyrophosphatase MutT (NUDIX family)
MSDPETLDHTVNQFEGVVVDRERLPESPDEFAARLAISMHAWADAGLRLIWLDIPTTRARLIPVAVEAGFAFHHTGEDYLTLTYRLRPDALIPSFATHFIGAGGVVLNKRRELLVVSERHRRDQSRPYYKLPGGALHPGEHLVDAVVREVYEETGVHAKFESLVCFRHWHGYRFGKSDIYFICRLSAISEEIEIQQDEIDESLWMPVETYLNNEYVSVFNKHIVRAAIESAGVAPTWVDGYADAARYEFFMPTNGLSTP